MRLVRSLVVALPVAMLAIVVAAASVGAVSAQEPFRFRPDDPLMRDQDDLPSSLPVESSVEDYYDGLENMFAPRGERAVPRALNINTLGEVPDSSWFTNRIGSAQDAAQVLNGPGDGTGPADGDWTVVGAKSAGVTPGFQIRDARGQRFLLKFDPPSNPQMATAAEAISTRLLHAFGYHVPQNHVVTFRPERLRIDPKARVTDILGHKRPMTEQDLSRLLRQVAARADGSLRGLASQYLDGRPVGPFLFHGTRGDDANDVFPHEHRRELRGYYVFCAWLNHDDSRSVNTLDMYVGEPDQGFVRHHLIDFGSTLGSGSVKAQGRRAGYEYMFEWTPVLKGLFGLGLWQRPWVGIDYPELPSIGRFEADAFEPQHWKPEYPNVAFDHMDLEDAYWAARILLRIGDAELRTAIAAGELEDPEAAEYLFECLRIRRDKTLRHWLAAVTPFDDFALSDRRLRWSDPGRRLDPPLPTPVEHGVVHSYHNPTGTLTHLGPAVVDGDSLVLPEAVAAYSDDSYFRVRLVGGPLPLDVYLRKAAGSFTVVGIDRNAPRRPARRDSYLWSELAR